MTKDWSFSALVEVARERILFDTGNDAGIFAANAGRGLRLRLPRGTHRYLKADLPVGQISEGSALLPVQPLLKKYSVFPKSQISCISLAVLSHRGAARDVTDAGRDAVDAAARLTGVACSGRRRCVVLMPRRWHQVGG